MRRGLSISLGSTLLALGGLAAIQTWRLMSDTETTTEVWMLRAFGAGLCIVGWGFALLCPAKWRRSSCALAALGTAGIVAAVTLLSQGMPT